MRAIRKRTSRKPAPGSGKVAMTYYRSAAKPDSSPFKRRSSAAGRGRRILSRLVNTLVLLLIASVLVYGLIVNSSPKMSVSSDLYHPQSAYLVAASRQLSSLKNRNKVTFDSRSILNHLKQQFPEISQASIELPLFNQQPQFRIGVAAPSLLLQNQVSSYIINTQGVAVNRAEALPQIKNLPNVIDQANLALSPGKRILSTGQVEFISTLVAQCQRASVPIKSINLPPQAQQLNLLTSDHNYYTKFFLDGEPLQQIGQFLAARHQFDEAASQPSDYLDVRVSGKVFYQ